MARLPRLKGIDLHARFGGILNIKQDCIPGPSSKYQLTETERAAHAVPSHVAGRKSAKGLDAGQCRAATAGTYVAGAVLFRCPGPPAAEYFQPTPQRQAGRGDEPRRPRPAPGRLLRSPVLSALQLPKIHGDDVWRTAAGGPAAGRGAAFAYGEELFRNLSSSCRRGRWLCRGVRIACDRKSGAFGVGAVNGGVAATSARGRLPPQGNRKAGTGPGGRNGEVVENMETKTRKRRLPKD
ncbi:hypothetical protein OOU_Y34scaffold00717g2 [Pyricularia oryzae Y34]|uniref:Uncharacterized protein n=2 Tax=Pyricularia oryzae TaxID=318829 RepID=A0AA97NS79_PYRO3|nr:hypothetical protein OOU_Y34scaffold00717g2 [Pyricularia oryzae Y34]